MTAMRSGTTLALALALWVALVPLVGSLAGRAPGQAQGRLERELRCQVTLLCERVPQTCEAGTRCDPVPFEVTCRIQLPVGDLSLQVPPAAELMPPGATTFRPTEEPPVPPSRNPRPLAPPPRLV